MIDITGSHLGELLRQLATQRQGRIDEGHLPPDHVHMMISIPRNTRFPRWSETCPVAFKARSDHAEASTSARLDVGFGPMASEATLLAHL